MQAQLRELMHGTTVHQLRLILRSPGSFKGERNELSDQMYGGKGTRRP